MSNKTASLFMLSAALWTLVWQFLQGSSEFVCWSVIFSDVLLNLCTSSINSFKSGPPRILDLIGSYDLCMELESCMSNHTNEVGKLSFSKLFEVLFIGALKKQLVSKYSSKVITKFRGKFKWFLNF